MKRPLRVKLLLLMLLILMPGVLLQGETNVITLIERIGGELLWDPILQRGIVNRGRTSVAFQVGIPYLLKDFDRIVDIEAPERKPDGAVTLSTEAAEEFIALFALPESADGFRISTIIIDPGHGGKDPGTIGTHGSGGEKLVLQEKRLVLDVARMLNERLRRAYPEKNILLTRDEDRYLTLEERTEFANAIELGEQEAMIFLSVHANASLNRRATGFEVWYLPPDYRRELIDPDELESEQQTVAPIINSILEEEFSIESIILAREVLKGMDATVGGVSENRGLKEESWFVVRNAKMPSVLVEIGFVTNLDEARRLADEAYLQKISDGIYNGLAAYIANFESDAD